MSKRRHEPARKHEQAGVAGVGTYADTVPGKGTAKRSRRATMVVRADTPETKEPTVAVLRARTPIVKPVKTSWTWTPEQRKAERRAKRRGAGTRLCPATPEGHVPRSSTRRRSVGRPPARTASELMKVGSGY